MKLFNYLLKRAPIDSSVYYKFVHILKRALIIYVFSYALGTIIGMATNLITHGHILPQ